MGFMRLRLAPAGQAPHRRFEHTSTHVAARGLQTTAVPVREVTGRRSRPSCKRWLSAARRSTCATCARGHAPAATAHGCTAAVVAVVDVGALAAAADGEVIVLAAAATHVRGAQLQPAARLHVLAARGAQPRAQVILVTHHGLPVRRHRRQRCSHCCGMTKSAPRPWLNAPAEAAVGLALVVAALVDAQPPATSAGAEVVLAAAGAAVEGDIHAQAAVGVHKALAAPVRALQEPQVVPVAQHEATARRAGA